MKITIAFLDKEGYNIFSKPFAKYIKDGKIDILYKNVGQCTGFDCVINTGNSYGLMDGGIDRTYNYLLQDKNTLEYIAPKVRKIIYEKYSGEQPVGTSFLVNTNSSYCPILAHTPTMIYPTDVSNTLNAYLAFKAAICKIQKKKNKYYNINNVLTSSLCTGAGKMSYEKAAQQMLYAYEVATKKVSINNWSDLRKHKEILNSLI